MNRSARGVRWRRDGERQRWFDTPSSILSCGAALWLVLGFATVPMAEEPSAEEEPAPASYVGDDETCGMCHDEKAAQFAKTPHAWAITEASRPPAERGCEACHGPAEVHVDEGGGRGVGNLQNFTAERPAAARSSVCLKCHGGSEARHGFRSSAHSLSGVACTDCHTGHQPRAEPLLQASPPQLCYGCHIDKQAAFALPEHHKVNEGVVSCSDCHQPHGSRNLRALRATNNSACFRCHADVEGPFVFEHPAVLLEGCVRCHDPHGSTNRHLLVHQQVAQLCYECHTVTPANHVQPDRRDCTRCHVSIHGSNVNPHFLQQ